MSPFARGAEYSSVNLHDNDEETPEEGNNEDETNNIPEQDDDVEQFHDENVEDEEAHRPRDSANARFRLPPPGPNSNGNINVFKLWLMLIGFLAVGVVGLLIYRKYLTVFGNDKDINHKFNGTNDDDRYEDDNFDNNDNAQSAFDDDYEVPFGGSGGSTGGTTLSPKPKSTKSSPYTITYDPMPHNWDPFGLEATDNKDTSQGDLDWSSFDSLPWMMAREEHESDEDEFRGGAFLIQPNAVNNMVVFVAEGDLYLTTYGHENSNIVPAMKLTTTVGNVRTPYLHATLPIVAYTATYTGRREVYLQDLRYSSKRTTAAKQLTYWDGSDYGVSGLVGWKDESTLLVKATSIEVSLPDKRIYELSLSMGGEEEQHKDDKHNKMGGVEQSPMGEQPNVDSGNQDGDMEQKPEGDNGDVPAASSNQSPASSPTSSDQSPASSPVSPHESPAASPSSPASNPTGGDGSNRRSRRYLASARQMGSGISTVTPLEITPVPLSQSVNGVFDEDCFFFTRFQQSSQTIRYVGGTAESLWLYCEGQRLAIPITPDYKGTSKNPTLWRDTTGDNTNYLFFLSDRNVDGEPGTWRPTTMNLWAIPLPQDSKTLYKDETQAIRMDTPIPLTKISCDFNGKSLQEYSVDSSTRHVVLRIGADLFLLRQDDVTSRLRKKESSPLKPSRLAIHVLSDFHETQERVIPLSVINHFKSVDAMETASGTAAALLTARGQVWVTPVRDSDNEAVPYQGSGQTLPERTYRLAPGSLTGGAMRILMARHVPLPSKEGTRRMCLILATDPLSPTAEHAFYLVESQGSAPNAFNDLNHLPEPFLGGGDQGGLGSVQSEDVVVSPCGRRFAWTDTDGRICVMTLPLYKNETDTEDEFHVLPKENELGEPIVGQDGTLSWSPGGRYLAIQHLAGNHFEIISIADLGDPQEGKIVVGRIAQATPSRFNSRQPYWGLARSDNAIKSLERKLSVIRGEEDLDSSDTADEPGSTTLYFLSDRDVQTDVSSPWGTRGPFPHWSKDSSLYGLPLTTHNSDILLGRFSGGGTMEISAEAMLVVDQAMEEKRTLDPKNESSSTEAASGEGNEKVKFPMDVEIDFGEQGLSFARRAYRIANVPKMKYIGLLSQTPDGSFALVSKGSSGIQMEIYTAESYPSDRFDHTSISFPRLLAYDVSTTRSYASLIRADGTIQVIQNKISSIVTACKDSSFGVANSEQVAFSVWPALEYKQMYNDAWRMLRDYFYDKEMHQVPWEDIHARYLPLVERCTKREDLDDILSQMAAELSALHVFVYGGEYSTPFKGERMLSSMHKPASLGAFLQRNIEWKGYVVKEIALCDPDYNLIEDKQMYSPLSDQVLQLSGQNGLEVGDVIVGVNGESAFRVPDIHMLLRGKAGQSVRLDVLRLSSGKVQSDSSGAKKAHPEPVLVVPIDQEAAFDLRYNAWEWKTRQKAKALAKEAGFSVGYIHLRSMSQEDADAFARSFFEDYDKEAMILDVRHNSGGSIDSWIASFLERKAWYFFEGRIGKTRGVDIDWNQQYAFRGHIVVLIDEKTSSDGEGISRAISELGIGVLIGKRTWGGGIWLSSDNNLVDGGIATAPEYGVFNDKWGWGMGIEAQGVEPDIEVDNNPREVYDGHDAQLERAIKKLKNWLKDEPIPDPLAPAKKPDMSLKDEQCFNR